MKILVCFVDMLRNELMKNNQNDMILQYCKEKLGGGIWFKNCYTPSPDTHRSMGCLWSGRYPKQNGCNQSYKRAFQFLADSNNSLLNKLLASDYFFNAFVGQWKNDNVGLFPCVYKNYAHSFSTGQTLDEFMDKIITRDNTFTFFNIEDLHFCMDDGKYTPEAFKRGEEVLVNIFDKLFSSDTLDIYDEVILFSDHGFRYYYELNGHMLDQRRTNIFLFWHSKNGSSFREDDRLASIMDIYPTLLDKACIEYDGNGIEGKSLFGTNIHDVLLFEDYEKFYVSPLEPVRQYAVLDKNGMIHGWLDSSYQINWEKPLRERYEELLCEKASGYEDFRKLSDSIALYQTIDSGYALGRTFSNGSERRETDLTFFQRINRFLHRGGNKYKNK